MLDIGRAAIGINYLVSRSSLQPSPSFANLPIGCIWLLVGDLKERTSLGRVTALIEVFELDGVLQTCWERFFLLVFRLPRVFSSFGATPLLPAEPPPMPGSISCVL